MKKPRIKRIKKDVNTRIFDNLVKLHGSYRAVKKYKYIQFKTEFQSFKTA